MKAIWNNKVIAQSSEVIDIEGNYYFPKDSLIKEFFIESSGKSTCPWKGEASYYNIVVNGKTNVSAAWYYPNPKKSAIETVGKDFSDYVSFWKGITYEE